MRMTCSYALLILAVVGTAQNSEADDPAGTYIVRVSAEDHDRQDTPIVVELPTDISDFDGFELQLPHSSQVVPMQRLPGEPPRALFVLSEPLAAGESRRYRLLPMSATVTGSTLAAEPAVRCRRTEVGLRIDLQRNLHRKPILQYNTDVVEPPAGIEGIYRRSGHIHPVFTPAGRLVTEEFPEDHPHQHGIFNAWVNAEFEGRDVDFWNQAGGTGNVEHIAVDSSTDGNVFARFLAKLRHSDLTHPDGPRPVLDEELLVRAFNVPRGHLFDIESRQICVAESPLLINEFHYGGMAYRGAAGWLGQPEHNFLTSEGKTRADGNHSRSVWVAAHGLVDGEPCAIVVFGHPDNFRHPQPVRLHPDKPYFVFTPPFLGEFSIAPGEEYVSQYRYLVHDGPLDPEWYGRVWQDIADPPSVRVMAIRE